eukprot:TRINITY_DN13740_c0_g1_i4.p1 TRINITY_DN13740_c0_g1~~TRINITY_DN13740_c0_g1_i4.p1  ORF type:complete len:156 (+),score=38.99 TRINITY_DN13740_c0_g1_i4:485-952(+)
MTESSNDKVSHDKHQPDSAKNSLDDKVQLEVEKKELVHQKSELQAEQNHLIEEKKIFESLKSQFDLEKVLFEAEKIGVVQLKRKLEAEQLQLITDQKNHELQWTQQLKLEKFDLEVTVMRQKEKIRSLENDNGKLEMEKKLLVEENQQLKQASVR